MPGHAPSGGPAPSGAALWGPVVAYMGLIFALSSLSAPPSPADVNDKLQHFVFYGGLAALTLRATSGGTLAGVTVTTALLAWAITTAYGASDEFHQSFVPGRSAELADLVADGLGAAAAVVVLGASGIIARSRRAAGGR